MNKTKAFSTALGCALVLFAANISFATSATSEEGTPVTTSSTSTVSAPAQFVQNIEEAIEHLFRPVGLGHDASGAGHQGLAHQFRVATPSTLVAPYVYTWGFQNSAYAFGSLMDAKNQVNLQAATLAFAISNPGCQVPSDFSPGVIADALAFSKATGKLIISFGGASGTTLEDACPDAQSLFNVMDQMVEQMQPYGLDFDVEGNYVSRVDLHQKRANAMAGLHHKHKNLKFSFTVPAGPGSGSNGGSMADDTVNMLTLTQKAGAPISNVNLMTMDYGSSFSASNQGQLAIECATQAAQQLQSLFPSLKGDRIYSVIGITPMIGKNDDGNVFQVSDAQEVTQFATQKHVGRLSFWALQRDQAGSGSLDIYSDVNTSNYQFYNTFKAVNP